MQFALAQDGQNRALWRYAVHTVSAKLSNEITPLDPDRGVRTSFYP